jgi:hypothetical protein
MTACMAAEPDSLSLGELESAATSTRFLANLVARNQAALARQRFWCQNWFSFTLRPVPAEKTTWKPPP